jgi:hypothetical protein
MINFIPNDPLAKDGPAMRKKKPRVNRPAGRAGLSFTGEIEEGLYERGTPGFLFWQCREAVLWAIEVWEGLDGKLSAWGTSSPKRLSLLQNAGNALNAGYSQEALEFYEFTTGDKTTFSGASTDVVSHEVGHALLDVIRPDLWTTSLPETNAFHEAFGDCMAVLTALSDRETRKAVLKVTPDLGKANFVDAVMEDLADGTKRHLGASFDASSPRRALNKFKWQLPTTLPTSGKPSALTSEMHSFGRIFSGCFYDLIRNIFASYSTHNQANLWKAAQTAGRLLISGARQAPETPRFFQSVGRAMVLADETTNNSAHGDAIRDAFTRHGLSLGVSAMLAPRASLAGDAPRIAAAAKGGPILTATTREDLRRRLGAAPQARITVSTVKIGNEKVAEAVHHREVSLTGLSERLSGVVAMVAEPVLVGSSGKRAAIVSAMPQEGVTTDEVHTFVESLLKNDAIVFEDEIPATTTKRAAIRAAGAARAATGDAIKRSHLPTHIVRVHDGKKVLTRIRFSCHF